MIHPKLKIVFLGTPEFAVPALDILVKNEFRVVTVVTSPDKPSGRGLEIIPSAVKRYAQENNLPVLQPGNLKDVEFLQQLESLKADLFVIVAFRMLPEAVWKMPAQGSFNLHASLLPQYRGAAPINRAIMNGETETGITTFFLQHAIDTGKIIFRQAVDISENETAGELHDRLMLTGANLVLKTALAIEQGNVPVVDQSNLLPPGAELKSAPKIFKENCRINWNSSVQAIHNHVRGLSPYPTAFTEFNGLNSSKQLIKIYKTRNEPAQHDEEPGTIVSDEKSFIKIAAADGFIFLMDLQQAGKKRMTVEEFLRGFRISQCKTAV